MADLKQWTMIFCAVCMALGILQMLLPQKEQSAGIKLVIGLYILVSVLQPSLEIDWRELFADPQVAVQQQPPQNFFDFVTAQAQQKLQKHLQSQLQTAGVQTQVGGVCLEYDSQNNTAEVKSVVLQGQPNDLAQQVTKQVFGTAVQVMWDEQEG